MKGLPMKRNGFTLVELLVAMGLLILVLGSMYSIFAFNQKTFAVQDQVLALNQNVLGSTEVIGREARSAGLKVALDSAGKLGPVAQMIGSGFLPANPAPLTVTLNPGDFPMKVTPGSGTSPDAITIVGAMGENTGQARLDSTASAGATEITLSLTGPETAARYTAGDVIYIGEDFENARVTAVAGSKLTIDTDPAAHGNQGLKKDRPAGSEVGKISVISYEVFSAEGALKRKENGGGFVTVATEVTDLQAVPNGKKTNVLLTARTAAPDRDYTDNGGYRKKVFSITVAPKNIQ